MVVTIAGLWMLHVRGKTVMWLIRRGMCRLRGHRLESRPLYVRTRLRLRISADDFTFGTCR
jgi:hypothetical protein